MIYRKVPAALAAVLFAVSSGGTLYAGSLQFGVVGSPIDLSANASESFLPGGTVFQESKPLFGTSPDPKQSVQLLHISSTGVAPVFFVFTGQSPFASSLAESNGNGGVGVVQVVLGSPGGSGQNVIRQMVAQSLWTQTFLYSGTPTVDLKLHLQIPRLSVTLFGVPPNRDNPSATETAQAIARVDTVITHPDGTFSKGGSFEFGLKEFETQIQGGPSGSLLNFTELQLVGPVGNVFTPLVKTLLGDGWELDSDSVSADVNLGVMHAGDVLAYIYTLTAEGTTHGFERGYSAFIGDPFGVDVVTNNLNVTVALADVPEPGTCALMLLGIAGLFVYRRHTS